MSSNHRRAVITRATLRRGFGELQRLSRGDYHRSVFAVVNDTSSSPEKKYAQLGRLVGVSMKEPFARSYLLNHRSKHSGSYRGWHLVASSFDRATVKRTWQYKTLEALRKAPGSGGYLRADAFASQLQFERGFFNSVARSIRDYLCGDQKLRKRVEKHLKAGERAGFHLKNVTPEVIVQGGGLALGSLLITHVPVLGIVGAPVLAGILLILYTIGIDAFCAHGRVPEFEHIWNPRPSRKKRRKRRKRGGS